MSGTKQAALLLMTLGEGEAAEVLKYMGPKEVQRLGTAMATLSNVSKDQASQVLDVFITDVEDQTAFGIGTEDYVRKVLTNAFGASKANTFIDRILLGHDAKGLDALKWMSPKDVAGIIEGEHPQIVAIVVACLEPEQAAEVIDRLSNEERSEVVMRIAQLNDVQQSALAEIENLIVSKSVGALQSGSEKVGGHKVAANIINALEASTSEDILVRIKDKNAELGDRIQEMIFVFDTLLSVDDMGIQKLLREVSSNLLLVALKGCDPAIKDKIMNNMSKRAGTLLREDMEALGPTKLSDVEAAQKEILEIARRMADEGNLILGRGSEEYV
ncbi:MAG: flagellar motor switch protein FliG [Woeseia sp.]